MARLRQYVNLTNARRLLNDMRFRRIILLTKRILAPVIYIAGPSIKTNQSNLKAGKPFIIIVSHEASATGAPILALNLVNRLSNKFNVITILMRGGVLRNNFNQNSIATIEPRFGLLIKNGLEKRIRKLCNESMPEYAIVNSVVSAGALQPLRSINIATITLIHEFGAYIKPIEVLENVAMWSTHLVFSSKLTYEDIISISPQLKTPFSILPQGQCKIPNLEGVAKDYSRSNIAAQQFLDSLDKDCLLVIGAGTIQPRKGIDLFVSTAERIIKQMGDRKVKFLWVGGGYDPNNDFHVSLWVEDQIRKSGLDEILKILDHTDLYSNIVERANIFIMSSRLDPLPNVAIDSLIAGKPTLCFDKACGISEMLKKDTLLKRHLVSQYIRTDIMANQAVELLKNTDTYNMVSETCKRKANEWFNMDSYIKEIDKLGLNSKTIVNKTLDDLNSLDALKKDSTVNDHVFRDRSNILKYLLAWRHQIWPPRPESGFHPGIYRDLNMTTEETEDPYIHYLRLKKPSGRWNQRIIGPTAIVSREVKNIKVALHIHVFYIELLEDILERLDFNKIRPDLFISFSDAKKRQRIEEIISRYNFDLAKMTETPNTGRDIGPFLTVFGKELNQNYDIYGHVHTKYSAIIAGNSAQSWRNFLLKNLLGTNSIPMADKIISSMLNDDKLGLVFPEDPTCVGWNANKVKAEELAKLVGLQSLPDSFNFPVGTMFWTKKGALNSLLSLNLTWSDYPQEPIPYDGTILHAIERLLPIIVESSGYTCAQTYLPKVKR